MGLLQGLIKGMLGENMAHVSYARLKGDPPMRAWNHLQVAPGAPAG